MRLILAALLLSAAIALLRPAPAPSAPAMTAAAVYGPAVVASLTEAERQWLVQQDGATMRRFLDARAARVYGRR